MKNSRLLLALTAFSALLASVFFPAAQAASEALPLCQDAYCQKIFHDKKLEQATVIVWTDKGNILSSYTFPLDKSAKLVNTESEGDVIAAGSEITPLNTTPPPPNCSSGSCSSSNTVTYETATSIVTITTVFIYSNGVLVGVETYTSTIKKPDDTRQEQ